MSEATAQTITGAAAILLATLIMWVLRTAYRYVRSILKLLTSIHKDVTALRSEVKDVARLLAPSTRRRERPHDLQRRQDHE